MHDIGTKPVAFRLPVDLLTRVDEFARSRGWTRARAVRWLLIAGLDGGEVFREELARRLQGLVPESRGGTD